MSDVKSSAPGRLRALLSQLGRFGLVGVLNTALDFTVFCALRVAGAPLVPANLASTSTGMTFSFLANRRFVFRREGKGSWRRQLLLFLLGTAFSMYVLQSAVIVLLTDVFPGPIDGLTGAAWACGLRSEPALMLVRSTSAKAGATLVSLTWNFVFYRSVVFVTSRRSGCGTRVTAA